MSLPTISETVTAYRELRSTIKVADRFGCSETAVRNRLKAAGEPLGPKGVRTRDRWAGGIDGERVVVAFRFHGSIAKAAAVVGVKEATARKWLIARGLNTSNRVTPQQRRDARRRYVRGESSREIAAALGVDAKTVLRALRAEGVQIRSAAPRRRRPASPTARTTNRQEATTP